MGYTGSAKPAWATKQVSQGRAKGKSRKQIGQIEGVGPEPLTMQISAEQLLSLALKRVSDILGWP